MCRKENRENQAIITHYANYFEWTVMMALSCSLHRPKHSHGKIVPKFFFWYSEDEKLNVKFIKF